MGASEGLNSPRAEENFVRRLRATREALGFSQGELAARVTRGGLSMVQQTVARLESGQRAVRLDEATVIAGALGLSLAEMIKDPVGRPLPFDVQDDIRRIEAALDDLEERIELSEESAKRARADLDALQQRKAALLTELSALEEHRTGVTAADMTDGLAELETKRRRDPEPRENADG